MSPGGPVGWLDPASVADAGAYLVRLVRLDPAALVRLRPAGDGASQLWARLPFEVLVTRRIRAAVAEDATVRAADLLAAVAAGADRLPARHDTAWIWPVPPGAGRVVERLPATEVRRLGAAAAATLREAAAGGVRGRAVAERALRDALLDHVAVVVVTDDGARIEVSQRLVQAVVRMGFVGSDPAGAAVRPAGGSAVGADVGPDVKVRIAAGWVGLAGSFGSGWCKVSTSLDVRPVP
ncbi:MAG: hypothetical protein QOE03_691 [Micromonosporaceae bacterium]|nr:hypothetical protein [Micromonosporaceae bacterium]